jgi:hypothetical protein
MTTIGAVKLKRYSHKQVKQDYTCTLLDQSICKLARSQGGKPNDR